MTGGDIGMTRIGWRIPKLEQKQRMKKTKIGFWLALKIGA
jgi:hypothetical protein